MKEIVEKAAARLAEEAGCDAARARQAVEEFAASGLLPWVKKYATLTLLPLFLQQYTAKETLCVDLCTPCSGTFPLVG